MYQVIIGGEHAGYSDTAVFIRVHENGCYVPCDEHKADGVCVKLPFTYLDDQGNTMQMVQDTVFVFKGHVMNGTETAAEIVVVDGACLLTNAEKVVSILLGGEKNDYTR